MIIGDANLCSEKWDSPNYKQKSIADELRETLAQCGIINVPLGTTYTADRLNDDGSEIRSALDHVYTSQSFLQALVTKKLLCTATDHVPVAFYFDQTSVQPRNKASKPRTITKRSMKDFTKTRWLDCLRTRDWTRINSIPDVNTQAEEFTREINEALDECAPFKEFKVRQSYKPGLSDQAKKIIRERDLTRKQIKKAHTQEKPALQAKYKQLRNRAVNQIRKDMIKMNGDKISKAGSEGETWRIINDIMNPRNDSPITINTAEGTVTSEQEVANTFNEYFIEKINNLKTNIDPNLTRDPLEKIEAKMKDRNLRFKLRTVSTPAVHKLMKKMTKKKSKGNDGITQECLLLGQDVLASPLTNIINRSIMTGIVPEMWKEAVVVPILKKGDPTDLKNYRPVSCLAAASKVLEKVVCEQLTQFVETHHLLPASQHGFRKSRSTMTALSAMQKEWIKNSEEGLVTGILVWDLSSAFDTLDIELFLKKMEIYGADELTLNWFRSFLSERSQRVKIGSSTSPALRLVSGVPQGGILSPIIFTLYTADMELWLKTSKLFNFADDTTTDNKGKSLMEIKNRLEEDARNVLAYMASNGLVANQSKTEFLVLNSKEKNPLTEITVGNSVVLRTDHTKLLGIIIEESQEWNHHFKSLKSSLNQRLFMIRRIKNQIPGTKLISIVHCLWISKLRYGLQLCSKVRMHETDPKSTTMKGLQLTQNRLLRVLNNSKTKDRIPTSTLLKKFDLLSVNQLAGQIKLIETWKAVHIEGYAIELDPYNKDRPNNTHELRTQTNRVFNDSAKLKIASQSFNIDAAKLWNRAPKSVTEAASLQVAKTAIRTLVLSFPI